MIIYGEKVYLRNMELEDMEIFREMLNDPDFEHTTVGTSFPISKYQQMKWYEKQIERTDSLRLAIVEIATDEVIGQYSINDIDWVNRTLSTGYKIIKSARGKGFAIDAQFAVRRYVFESMNMHRINGSVIAYNEASQGVIAATGTKIEGVKREAVYRDGKYYDLYMTGTLYEDFLEAAKKRNWMNYGEKE